MDEYIHSYNDISLTGIYNSASCPKERLYENRISTFYKKMLFANVFLKYRKKSLLICFIVGPKASFSSLENKLLSTQVFKKLHKQWRMKKLAKIRGIREMR